MATLFLVAGALALAADVFLVFFFTVVVLAFAGISFSNKIRFIVIKFGSIVPGKTYDDIVQGNDRAKTFKNLRCYQSLDEVLKPNRCEAEYEKETTHVGNGGQDWAGRQGGVELKQTHD